MWDKLYFKPNDDSHAGGGAGLFFCIILAQLCLVYNALKMFCILQGIKNVIFEKYFIVFSPPPPLSSSPNQKGHSFGGVYAFKQQSFSDAACWGFQGW